MSALAECEQVIERGLGSFVEVGNALMRIRDDELYREAGFSGFVEYLESKPWGIGQRRAYDMIDAASVCTIVQIPNIEQGRELAPLMRKATPEVVKQVYADVVEETDGKPTASAIREKVREITQNDAPARHSRSDYNKRIDEGVIPKLKAVNEARLEAEDWHSYSRTTLRRHIAVMTTSHRQVGEWIAQAEKILGSMPAK